MPTVVRAGEFVAAASAFGRVGEQRPLDVIQACSWRKCGVLVWKIERKEESGEGEVTSPPRDPNAPPGTAVVESRPGGRRRISLGAAPRS
jgi:hypothetical protein